MQFVSTDVLFHENRRVDKISLFRSNTNSFSSIVGLNGVLFVALNQLITTCENVFAN